MQAFTIHVQLASTPRNPLDTSENKARFAVYPFHTVYQIMRPAKWRQRVAHIVSSQIDTRHTPQVDARRLAAMAEVVDRKMRFDPNCVVLYEMLDYISGKCSPSPP